MHPQQYTDDLTEDVVDLATLTGSEIALLRYLVDRPGQLVSRAELLTEVWGYHPSSTSRAVDKTLARLRAKVEDCPSCPRLLHTVHGQGVRFTPPGAERAAHNVPAPLDAWFGRVEDLDTLRAQLEAGRTATVIGAPGVGKTRLVLEATRAWVEDGTYPATWICPLGSASSREDFLSVLGEVLGVRPVPRNGIANLVPALRNRGPMLLVLDDVDRILDVAAEAITRWCRDVSTLRVICTSRERLAFSGETVLELDGLGSDASTALLCCRAGWLDPHDKTIRAIATKLEGLPLALELVAAHGQALPPEMLVDRLDWAVDHPVLRDRPSRHATLTGAIRWSWQGLDEPCRRTLSQATVFRGFIPPSAISRVFDCHDSLDAIAALRAGSMLWQRGAKLGMYDAVRNFAARKLGQEERLQTRHRHAAFCADRAERIVGEHGWVAGSHILDRQVGWHNMRAALSFAHEADCALAQRLRLVGNRVGNRLHVGDAAGP